MRCIHYWIIDNKNFGICKKCGGERKFPFEPKMNKNERRGRRVMGNYPKSIFEDNLVNLIY